MAKKRGFFAELQHQAQQAEKRRQQQEAAAQRARAAAQRAHEQRWRAYERAQAAAARASAAERKAAEKEAARLFVEARLAEVDDAYHDNAQSFLLMAPPGGQAVIYCGHGYQAQADDGDHAATLTLTAGGTCLVGVKDFRPAPGVVDPVLSPGAVGPLASAELVGRFTNEQPPTDETDWAWTNSFEILRIL